MRGNMKRLLRSRRKREGNFDSKVVFGNLGYQVVRIKVDVREGDSSTLSKEPSCCGYDPKHYYCNSGLWCIHGHRCP